MKNKALISFSFDDGRIDNYEILYPLLKQYNLPATLNITTGFVKGDNTLKHLAPAAPMNLGMIKELFQDNLIEIASHGYYHRNTKEDILSGQEELLKELHVDKFTSHGNGFASPGTALEIDAYMKMKQELNASHLEYVRLSLRYLSYPSLKIFLRKVSRVLKWPILYRLAYQDTLMSHVEDGILYSIPVLSTIKVSELKALIKYAELSGKACILMFHSIVEDGKIRDNWDYELTKFIHLCKFLVEEREKQHLDIVTSMEIFQRLK
jgi:hypothetical protein